MQARVIHSCSPEWLKIKEAAEKAKDAAVSEGDEIVEMTCSELLEALELSRCLLLMKCVCILIFFVEYLEHICINYLFLDTYAGGLVPEKAGNLKIMKIIIKMLLLTM